MSFYELFDIVVYEAIKINHCTHSYLLKVSIFFLSSSLGILTKPVVAVAAPPTGPTTDCINTDGFYYVRTIVKVYTDINSNYFLFIITSLVI